ncbi:MAG: KpsF/GutQ family sugar-phosphate isomerase [Gammaproteobacteria bacterium]|nr:KpsF/GutQ family sugar-phosphate isomerase [Gammaproteobacteria bacterium]NNJ73107.1 KpsF/GutQ family sugar-phosphate isomerase [Enterobacterales bacterium]
MSSGNKYIELAQAVLDIEAKAVAAQSQSLDAKFTDACEILLHCAGRVVVIGMGKSGHIGSKIAATLASTGTPAFFVHPGEASHGDLGMITKHDVVLALSFSGETGEILNLLPVIKRLGVSLISMTGESRSSLAVNSDVHLKVHVDKEACPMNLAPTASTTATLALGDAIAISLLTARGFKKEDFALSHPGGSLGRRLLLHVDDIMHTKNELPAVTEDTLIKDALLEMTRSRLGMTTILDKNGMLAGIYTDGDLRRTLEDKSDDILNTSIADVMTVNCTTVKAGTLAFEALSVMEQKKINGLIIVDETNKPVGALNMYDLLKSGVM